MDAQPYNYEERPAEQPRKNYALHMILSVLAVAIGIVMFGLGASGREPHLWEIGVGILLLLGGFISATLKQSKRMLQSLVRAAVVWLGVQAFLYSTVWLPANTQTGLFFHVLTSRVPQPYRGIVFILCTFVWIAFTLLSLTVLVWALVRFRQKEVLVPSVISVALGAYIFLCYIVLFASSHD